MAVLTLNYIGVNLRVNNIFKPSQEMIEYCKLMPSEASTAATAEETATRARHATENYQNDPFTSTAQNRDRSDLSYNNHPSFFNRLNEGTGSVSHLETPTAQSSGSGPHDLFAANGVNDKPPPVRKTRAAAADPAIRKLTSRSTRDNNADMKRPNTEPTAPAAPARRSTRLNTLKFGSKLGTAERETRLAAKEREREQKKRAVSARMRTNLIGGVAMGKEKEKDRGSSEDVNVRGNPTSRHRPSSLNTACDSLRQHKRKEPPESSLTRVTKKQMSDVTSKTLHAPLPPAKPQTDKSKEEAQLYLLDMYKKFGNGYFNLNRYHCPEALQAFGSLSSNQRDTPRIQCLMGKAYYEMAQYKEVCS